RSAPRLVELLRRHGASATFYFNLGPQRLHRWLPGRSVAARAADAMRAVRDAGFEVGLHGWDCARWRDRVAHGDFGWTEAALRRACATFERVFGEPPRTHAAPGWQMNRHAFRLTQRLGFDYASDTRGSAPFVPVIEAELVACPQVPTTLPTLRELIGRDGARRGNVHERILAATAAPTRASHVFTLFAERDAGRHLSACDRLLAGWRALGWEIVPLHALAQNLEPKALEHHVITTAPAADGRGTIAAQGRVFLA
ncbi:MAG: polysaccharide deacetylase family protein, partial [Burkholderiales bacterium]